MKTSSLVFGALLLLVSFSSFANMSGQHSSKGTKQTMEKQEEEMHKGKSKMKQHEGSHMNHEKSKMKKK